MPRTLTAHATLDKSPGLHDSINERVTALEETSASPARGSPEPRAAQRVESPALTSFPARRRSIASPARRRSFAEAQPSALASEGRVRVPNALPGGRSLSSGACHSDSSSSLSSCSSSSSSAPSSLGEPKGEDSPSICASNKWGCPFKEGQRFPTPAVSDTARDFFVTLHEENPQSYIATAWLVEHGVFPLAKHNQLLKQYEVQKEHRRKAHAEALADPDRARKVALYKKRGTPKLTLLHKRERALKKR